MANPKAGENGKETRFRSGKEAAKNGRKGGIKSGETRKYNASFRAAGKEMLTDEKLQKMWTAMIKRAEQGNITAFKTLFDLMGEAEADSTDKNAEVNLAFIAPVSAPETPPEEVEDEVEDDE